MIVSKKELLSHQISASLLNVDQLETIIFDLCIEKKEMLSFITPKEIESYDSVIDIYQKELKLKNAITINNYSTLLH